MLSRLATAHGVSYAETLTGFKWIMRAGDGLVYGYEEALGYAIGPDVVRDKDGISAALLVAELAAQLRAHGRTLLDRRAPSPAAASSRSAISSSIPATYRPPTCWSCTSTADGW